MRPQILTTVVMSNDADGIAASQAVASATTMLLNGAIGSVLANAQKVGVTSGGNDSGITFTVVGTDADGVTISEAVTGANAGVATSTAYFKTVTSITTSAAVATTALVGTLAANGLVTQSVPCNWRQSAFNMSVRANLTAGTGGTFGCQYSVDPPNLHWPDPPFTNSYSTDADWADVANLDPDTNAADDDTDIYAPVRAVRGKFTTGSTDMVVKFTFIQGDNQ